MNSNTNKDSFNSLYPKYEFLSKDKGDYIVCAMYTPNLKEKSLDFLKSVTGFKLSYSIYEIPHIHSSISYKGVIESLFHKPNFIRSMIKKYKKPILYLDIDCILRSNPVLISEIKRGGYDLAIFNWLSNERNDTYYPINGVSQNKSRFYYFKNGIFLQSETQLICSGVVQFWNDSESSFNLLNKWSEVIEANPTSADDWCLDFAFNNSNNSLKLFNLPKSYARYAFWIFDKPVIDHPDIPTLIHNFVPLKIISNKKNLYQENCVNKLQKFYLLPNLVLDTYTNEIYQMQNDIRILIGRNILPIYIY